jgi:hypothetical protein
VRMILGRKGGGYVARWDQIDLSDPVHPRLACSVCVLRAIACGRWYSSTGASRDRSTRRRTSAR